jgi:hypothetical protein
MIERIGLSPSLLCKSHPIPANRSGGSGMVRLQNWLEISNAERGDSQYLKTIAFGLEEAVLHLDWGQFSSRLQAAVPLFPAWWEGLF